MEIQNCSICLEQIGNKEKCKIDGCSHEHHYECLKKWMERENSCPQCRKKFTKIYNWKGRCENVEERKQRIAHENLGWGNNLIGFQFVSSGLITQNRDTLHFHNETLTFNINSLNVNHQNNVVPPFFRQDNIVFVRSSDNQTGGLSEIERLFLVEEENQRLEEENQRLEDEMGRRMLEREEELRRRKEEEEKKIWIELYKEEDERWRKQKQLEERQRLKEEEQNKRMLEKEKEEEEDFGEIEREFFSFINDDVFE